MSHTVIGVFEHTNQAQEAKAYLLANGLSNENVDINSGSSSGSTYTTGVNTTDQHNDDENIGDRISNFFSNLFSDDDDDARTAHTEAARRGVTVTVHARSEEEALQAARILDNYGAVDVDEYAQASRGAYDTSTTDDYTDTDNTGTIPVIEEELQVGKREVETGGVRLRSRIVERPVEESIRLREEHVNVERTPVDRPATEADFNTFNEGTVEVTEHAERPVVSKEARVVEEVSLDKDVSEREHTVSDTVRHTEVDTEDLDNKDTYNKDTYINSGSSTNGDTTRY